MVKSESDNVSIVLNSGCYGPIVLANIFSTEVLDELSKLFLEVDNSALNGGDLIVVQMLIRKVNSGAVHSFLRNYNKAQIFHLIGVALLNKAFLDFKISTKEV